MRTKFLLAMALPMIFAACSNEDDLMISQEVAGQKLASKTILTVGRTEADTKLNADGWENGDKVGLAWFNNTANGAITDDQGKVVNNNITTADNKIYANHLFTYADGSFTNEGDIYNGSYFAYFPYARQNAGNGASEKVIQLNTKQAVAEASKAFFAGVFSISARDMITAENINDNGAVEKQFSLKQLANGLAIKTTLGNMGDYTKEQIEGMKITKVTLSVTKNAFATSFTLNPQKLPVAVYTEGVYDAKKTLAKMTVNDLIGADDTKAVEKTVANELSVEVGECGATLASDNDAFLLFTLPTDNTTGVAVSDVALTIRTVAGEMTLKYTANAIAGSVAEANNTAIEKLVAMLGTGYGADKVKLSDIVNKRVGLDFKVDMSKFTPINDDIKTAEEWNAAVKYFDTFMPSVTPTFTITGDIEFTSAEPMTLPKKGLKDITGSNTITIKSGASTIDKKIETCSVDLTIAKDASLTVAADAAADKKPLLTLADQKTITNNGTLTVNGEIAGVSGGSATIANNKALIVGQDGKINSGVATTATIVVNNAANATITIGYNSYVHHNATGTIKGVIDGNDAVAKNYYSYLIARMVAAGAGASTDSGKEGSAVACNTIELKNINVAEGDKSIVSSEDLPWGEAGVYPVGTETFKGIEVILNAATLKSVTGSAMEYKTITSEGASALAGVFTGGAVTVKSGSLSVGQYSNTQKVATNSTLTIISANLEVKEGATLNVDRTTIATPAELNNAGAINLTGKNADTIDGIINATKIMNKKTGNITVGVGGKMTYAGQGNFTNEEGAKSTGNIVSIN
ncbi:fimbrillin family protein [Bacteroides rodentium]|uniref:fimbrillin family protein n=1 Tax=Bacteroides rodentium TaxID=691816 RepID=UPI0010083ABF|nr:fimbrillin family protein [Bacteroides rodentium]